MELAGSPRESLEHAGLLLLVVISAALGGCASPQPTDPGTLYLNPLVQTPRTYANVTDNDLERYPPLKTLVEQWSATGNGTSITYQFLDGLRIVRELQGRVPGGWPYPDQSSVAIRYAEHFFELLATKPVPD